KVAVLDTGLDSGNPLVEVHADRIRHHNWFDKSKGSDIADTNGHGTHTAALILDYIPDAEVYVSKVTDGKHLDPNIIALVLAVKAVDHAITEKVDILSISIGFPQRVPGYEVLQSAIDRAHAAHVLVFAAASNGGGNNDRTFPARHDHVFCVHSTDSRGNRSTFSPTPEHNNVNFATTGEAIESAWPVHLCDDKDDLQKMKSGTSYATPIAASIASFLLLYAR
ncbi:subtilisin-like protein, partial [Setomelanomma holmii]